MYALGDGRQVRTDAGPLAVKIGLPGVDVKRMQSAVVASTRARVRPSRTAIRRACKKPSSD